MEHRDDVPEAGSEAPDRLGGEADLRHQDDRRASALQRRRDRAQVDLGLAGSGDPVQQEPPRLPSAPPARLPSAPPARLPSAPALWLPSAPDPRLPSAPDPRLPSAP